MLFQLTPFYRSRCYDCIATNFSCLYLFPTLLYSICYIKCCKRLIRKGGSSVKKTYAIPVLKVMEGLFLLIKLNVLMLLTTLLGVVIFGFFPSLNAAITVTKMWLAGESDKPFVKTYMESFKKNFLRSNMYGWLCFLPCGYSRFSDYKTPINYKKIC